MKKNSVKNFFSSILTFSLEEKILDFYKNYKSDITLFLRVFTVLVLIYGQKLFFHSLATDDFMRLFLQ